jgi:hypothetical protein
VEATRIWADELTRLQAVQDRVRCLARNHGWFGDAIRAALDDFLRLRERCRREQTAMHNQERGLARDLLVKGFLSDPEEEDNTPCLFVPVRGLCPVVLADQLAKFNRPLKMPRELELEGAKVALAAFDREEEYSADCGTDEQLAAISAHNRAAIDAGTHVWFSWTIVVLRPGDWQHPPDPGSLDRVDLERFSHPDFLTIALHRLGGLADVGALRPIVPEPKDTGDRLHDLPRFFAWRGRLPVEHEHLDHSQPPLSVRKLPADVAEQLLHDVETWAEGEARKHDESLTSREPSVSPHLLDQLQRAAAAVDLHAIDHAAERAVEKVVRAVHGGDANGGSEGTPRKPGGWTKKELIDQADVSATVFDRIRKAASVKPSEKGGRGTQRRFSNAELRKLIAAVEAGTYRSKREIVKAWSELLPIDRETSHQ